MKVTQKEVERSTIQKDYVVVIETPSGIEITMYGEIINGKVEIDSTGPLYWNSKIFNSLSEIEQTEVVKITNSALNELL